MALKKEKKKESNTKKKEKKERVLSFILKAVNEHEGRSR